MVVLSLYQFPELDGLTLGMWKDSLSLEMYTKVFRGNGASLPSTYSQQSGKGR